MDWTGKDKDQTYKDKDQTYQDKDLTHKDQDLTHKDLNLVLKESLRTRINITGVSHAQIPRTGELQTQTLSTVWQGHDSSFLESYHGYKIPCARTPSAVALNARVWEKNLRFSIEVAVCLGISTVTVDRSVRVSMTLKVGIDAGVKFFGGSLSILLLQFHAE